MAKQLNIFLENRPGRLKSITETLFKNDINVIAFSIQDRGDFGMVKLLVNKPDKAHLVLSDAGFACAVKNILVISIPDKPGNLLKLTSMLLEHKLNVANTYGFTCPHKQGVCSLELENADAIRPLLEKEGFTILDDQELAQM